MNMKFIAAAAAVALIVPAQAFVYSTGFESGEGWSLGAATGQNGFTSFEISAGVPGTAAVISDVNPLTGDQHLSLLNDPNVGPGALNGVFTPDWAADIEADHTFFDVSFDVFISNTGGADYQFAAQNPTAGFLNWRVNFDWQNNIQVLDSDGAGGFVFVDTGIDYTVGEYVNFRVFVDSTANTADYYYGGNLIYSGVNVAGVGNGVNQVILFNDNFHLAGESGDIDNFNFETSAVPEPGTMIALGAGLAALAARKRNKKA